MQKDNLINKKNIDKEIKTLKSQLEQTETQLDA
jgi:hypothetical protein